MSESVTSREPAPNETIAAQLAHRSIRAYTAEPIDEATMQSLLDVAAQAATSSFYQQRTIIRVKDPEVRQRIFESSGQPYVGGARGELLIFVVDLHRNAQIRARQGASLEPLESTALFLQGVEDILIAAQNVVVAAESLGLGTVYLGSIGGDPRKVIDALRLPKRTFPLVGLLIGHADQEPQLKPRLPKTLTVGVDAYPDLSDHDEALAAYDEIVQTYYDLRDTSRRIDSFSRQIATKPGSGAAEQAPVLEVLHDQLLALR
ncbi:NADPH-dependent oxidoreductase [Pseudoclavibacter sp. 13-3]|uniref:NADPH-dependent oxidoreductase n=1 Tax=Pseudoclavibacter sp. 13-3 TaxID=2901228 RepID=UPI001E4D0B65|nr:NADPH-dependent oxidoreductase [Pseudoclavibacter sp. 13-3]